MKGDPNVGRLSSSSAIKKREKPSEVWKEMRKYKDEYENEMAECIHCKATFDASSKKGTTHLKRHLESKKCHAKRQKGPGPRGRDGDYQVQSLSPSIKTKELASLIKENSLRGLIRHFSNREGDTSGYEQSEVPPSDGWEILDASVLNSIKDEILQLYQEEKEKLCQFLNKLSCRFCLQIVYQFYDYFFVVHYIDDSWERQSKIIGYRQGARNDVKDLIEAVKQLCLDWEIDGNICSLLFPLWIRRADDGDNQIGEMASWFSQRGSPPLPCFIRDNNTFMHNIPYILRSENYAEDAILSIRKCAEYVFYKLKSDKSSLYDAVQNSLYELKCDPLSDKSSVYGAEQNALCEVECDPFLGDIFRYFELAVRFKEAFFILENFDSGFRSINLTKQKWEEVTDTFEHLKFLSGVDCSLLERQCEIPIIVDIPYVGKMLKDRFKHPSKYCLFCDKVVKRAIDLYFREYYLLRVIAVILDPRFKMDGVQLHYNEIYGRDADRYVEKVDKDFRDVYYAYAAIYSSNSKSYEMLDAMGRRSSPKSELDRYFNLLIPRDKPFDILAWWRGNAPSYPTLARMARDYLVPFDCNGGDLIDKMDDLTFIIFKGEAAREIASPLVCLKGFLSTANLNWR